MPTLISTLGAGRRFADDAVRPFLPVHMLVVMATISLALVTPYVTQAQSAEEEIKAVLAEMDGLRDHGRRGSLQ